MSANCDIIVFSRFMANLQPSRSRIPDAWFTTKLTFKLAVTVYPKKTENRNKKSLTQLSYYLLLTDTFCKTAHVSVLPYQISSF